MGRKDIFLNTRKISFPNLGVDGSEGKRNPFAPHPIPLLGQCLIGDESQNTCPVDYDGDGEVLNH